MPADTLDRSVEDEPGQAVPVLVAECHLTELESQQVRQT